MSRIKRCVNSRWEGGCIVEIDYKQLEVVVLALLSGDTQLIQDLNEGLDMHSLSATFLMPEYSYEDIVSNVEAGSHSIIALRKKAKACSFLVQFGGGAKTLANNTGIELYLAEQFISNYYKRYPEVKAWQDQVQRQVESRTEALNGDVVGTYTSPLGTDFKFKKHPLPWDDNVSRYKPTEIKNYPVQGTAADIVKTAFAILVPVVFEFWGEDVKVINTIHDSFILDVKDKSLLPEVYKVCKHVLTNEVMETLSSSLGIDFPVKLAVDIEAGNNWGELKEVHKYVSMA